MMKLATFERENKQQLGVIGDDGAVIPLQENHCQQQGKTSPYFQDMLSFISNHNAAQALAETVIADPAIILSPAACTLLSPVPRPESIRDCMVFEQHIINCIRTVGLGKLGPIDTWLEKKLGRSRSIAGLMNKAWYARPHYYKSNRFSVVGDGAEVHRPSYTKQLDYELEWGVFIGKQGKNIPREKAHEYIAGYTIFNDFSARDIQLKEQAARLGPAKGKDFDTGNAIGPYLVTKDDIPDPYNLRMTASINGEIWSEGTTADMHWTFEEIIAHISQSETLYPGEFIGSGTCSGNEGSGCGLEMGRFLSPGDTVRLEVEKIGVLTNTVVDDAIPE